MAYRGLVSAEIAQQKTALKQVRSAHDLVAFDAEVQRVCADCILASQCRSCFGGAVVNCLWPLTSQVA